MQTKQTIISKIENLLVQLDTQTEMRPQWNDSPVSQLLHTLHNSELSPTQKLIYLHMQFDAQYDGETQQKAIVDALQMSNKAVRENLIQLLELGYVTRGNRIYCWAVKE